MMGVDWSPERFREWPGVHRDDRLAGGSVDPHTHLQEGGLTRQCAVVGHQEHWPVHHEGEGVPHPPPVLSDTTGQGGQASQPQAPPGRGRNVLMSPSQQGECTDGPLPAGGVY